MVEDLPLELFDSTNIFSMNFVILHQLVKP